MSEKNVTELENLILEIEHHIEDLENASIKDNFDRCVEIKQLNTIPYEVTCNISKRVPRIYINKED